MHPYQKINHFPGMYTLARKNLLGKALMKMRKQFPEEYSFFPLTWHLPSEFSDLSLYFENQPSSKTYIAKPEALSQGKGIFLTNKLS
jgi:tubulin polyglutamylase TTLL6/13